MKKHEIKHRLTELISFPNVGRDFQKQVYRLGKIRGSGLVYFFDTYMKLDWKSTVFYIPYNIVKHIERNGESIEFHTVKGKIEINLPQKKKIVYL